MTFRVPICGRCGKESWLCSHKQPGWGEMWLDGKIVSIETRQPIGKKNSTEPSKNLSENRYSN